MKNSSLFWLFGSILLFSCGRIKNHSFSINPDEVQEVALVRVEHHYHNEDIDHITLPDSLKTAFFESFNNSFELRYYKIGTCYELRIIYKNGESERFITDGRYMERIDENMFYKFLGQTNVIKKFWGIGLKERCVKQGNRGR
jgi:hypothetical protein